MKPSEFLKYWRLQNTDGSRDELKLSHIDTEMMDIAYEMGKDLFITYRGRTGNSIFVNADVMREYERRHERKYDTPVKPK